jgi:hypothetical protein
VMTGPERDGLKNDMNIKFQEFELIRRLVDSENLLLEIREAFIV